MNFEALKLEKFCLLLMLATTVLVASCGKQSNETTKQESKPKTDTVKKQSSANPLVDAGKELFYMKSKANNNSCSYCHSDGTNTGKSMTKFFSNIQGADKRTSTYLGKFTGDEVKKNAGGATVCWESYMKMKTPLTDEQINALNAFYESVAGSNPPSEIKYETIALPVKDKAKLKNEQKLVMGLKPDSQKGEELFNNSCGTCHGENHTVKAPPVLEDYDGNVKSIVYNVRLGDGAMPFFKKDVLSDQELSDIADYIMKKNGK